MTTFSVRFLGCKVSHVDAHAVRERLLADGHMEREGGADVAVVNTCCVTHEAVAKSRKEAARAARTHRRVYVTGCGANLAGDAFAGLPDNVVVQTGNNGPIYSDDLVALHDALRGVPHVFLVNVDVPRSWQGEVNSILAEAARSWGQAELVDWHSVASSKQVTTDGVHLTAEGITLYSRLIARAVKDVPDDS